MISLGYLGLVCEASNSHPYSHFQHLTWTPLYEMVEK